MASCVAPYEIQTEGQPQESIVIYPDYYWYYPYYPYGGIYYYPSYRNTWRYSKPRPKPEPRPRYVRPYVPQQYQQRGNSNVYHYHRR